MEETNFDQNKPPQQSTNNRDQNMFAMLCHLTALSGLVIPFGNIIGPLVIWLMKKDVYPVVDD